MSTSPIKESSPAKAEVTFTEKEERVLKAAWSCLKSPPEIDIEKLKDAAGFNTTKTASNTWGNIKKKLASMTAGEGEGGDSPTPKTKEKATPKKRGKKATVEDADDDDEGETPTKKRKTPKKAVKAAEDDAVKSEEE